VAGPPFRANNPSGMLIACFGVKGRGKFYEESGIIRDVIQNHLPG
jgi:hypothetical protein